MEPGLLPCLGIELRHPDIGDEVQQREGGGEELGHVRDDSDGQAKNNRNQAQDIHESQDINPGTLLVLLAEDGGEPSVITGLADSDGVIGKAGVQGGQQRHDWASNNESVEQRQGENALRRKHQCGGSSVFLYTHNAHTSYSDADVQHDQGGNGQQQDHRNIPAGVLGITAIGGSHVVALGGVHKQKYGPGKAAGDLSVLEGDAPSIDQEVGIGEVEYRQLDFKDADKREENQRGNQQPSHQLLRFGHDVHAHQVDHIKEGQQGGSDNDPRHGRTQRGDNVAQIGRGGHAEQGEADALGQVHKREHTGDAGARHTAQHGIVAASHADSGGNEHSGKDHDETHDNRHEISQPSGIAGHLDGGYNEGDDAGSNDLADGQGVQLGLAKYTGTGFLFSDHFNCHVFSPLHSIKGFVHSASSMTLYRTALSIASCKNSLPIPGRSGTVK